MSLESERFLVLDDDHGIRPAGSPDACFYCRRKVGKNHADDCVTIVVDVAYEVLLGGESVGVYRTTEPAHWTTHDGEFQKNDGSWCASNILDTDLLDVSLETRARLEALDGEDLDGEDRCLCSAVVMRELERGSIPRRGS